MDPAINGHTSLHVSACSLTSSPASSAWGHPDAAGVWPLQLALLAAASCPTRRSSFSQWALWNSCDAAARATAISAARMGLADCVAVMLEAASHVEGIRRDALQAALEAGHLEIAKMCWQDLRESALETWGSARGIMLVGPDGILTLELPGTQRDQRYCDLVEWLVSDCQLDPTKHSGKSTCLHQAVLASSPKALQYLLTRGADQLLQTANEAGLTPLHLACTAGSTECVEILTTLNPLLCSVVVGNHWTPLSAALDDCLLDVVELLLRFPELSLMCGDGVNGHILESLKSQRVFEAVKRAALPLMDVTELQGKYWALVKRSQTLMGEYVDLRRVPTPETDLQARAVLKEILRALKDAAVCKPHDPAPWRALSQLYEQMELFELRDKYAVPAFICDPIGHADLIRRTKGDDGDDGNGIFWPHELFLEQRPSFNLEFLLGDRSVWGHAILLRDLEDGHVFTSYCTLKHVLGSPLVRVRLQFEGKLVSFLDWLRFQISGNFLSDHVEDRQRELLLLQFAITGFSDKQEMAKVIRSVLPLTIVPRCPPFNFFDAVVLVDNGAVAIGVHKAVMQRHSMYFYRLWNQLELRVSPHCATEDDVEESTARLVIQWMYTADSMEITSLSEDILIGVLELADRWIVDKLSAALSSALLIQS